MERNISTLDCGETTLSGEEEQEQEKNRALEEKVSVLKEKVER